MMESDRYSFYCSQLDEVTKKYRNLKPRLDEKGLTYLKGILDIPNDSGEIEGSFLIEIHFKSGFPYRFPELFETGGIIPKEADWHKYANGSCCITVPPDEILKCRNGITVLHFVTQFAVPYFANYLYRIREGRYLNGEYAHNVLGLAQFYTDLLGTSDQTKWVHYFKCTFHNEKVGCERNDQCFCNSGKKYKHCHLEAFNNLRLIGEQVVKNDLIKICL